MQSKIIATLVVASAVITAVSCKWFQSNSSANKQFNIVGKWKIDSMYSLAEKPSDITSLLLAVASKDSANTLVFNNDSTVNDLSSSKPDHYYLKDSVLFIKEDSVYNPYQIKVSSDSLISVTSKDSMVMTLKKQ